MYFRMTMMETFIFYMICGCCLVSTLPYKRTTSDEDARDKPKTLTPEIVSVLGQTFNFSHLLHYTAGVTLTLGGKPVHLDSFTVDMSNAYQLDALLLGRSLSEFIYVASKLAWINVKLDGTGGQITDHISLEELFDRKQDIIMRARIVDAMEREITENPSVLDLHSTSGSTSKRRPKRNIFADPNSRWQMPVPYVITSDFKGKTDAIQGILEGIQHWEEETCLTFQQYESFSGPHIRFQQKGGCNSEIGMLEEVTGQTINLDDECATKGPVAHEVGHALGFEHEHQRPDRDRYVTIVEKNMIGDKSQMMKLGWKDTITLGIPYDYSSLMHYVNDAFSNESLSLQTIVAKEPDMETVMGQDLGLSFYDVKMANYLYCQDNCSQGLVWAACKNDGYRDPKNCTRCRCPDGLSGTYCTEVESGVNAMCGSTELTAGSSWKTLKSPNYDGLGFQGKSECTWRIKANENKRVRLQFVGDFMFSCFGWYDCPDYIEVRYQQLNKAGPRYCCDTRPQREFVSHGTEVLLLLRSYMEGSKGFALMYTEESCGGCSTPVSQTSVTSNITAPPCVDTQLVMCNGTYNDTEFGSGMRYNTCYEDVKSCCDGFQLRGNYCYGEETQNTSSSETTTAAENSSFDPQFSVLLLVAAYMTAWMMLSQCRLLP